jgi:hypothetical protein
MSNVQIVSTKNIEAAFLFINIFPVAECHDIHGEYIIKNIVDNAVLVVSKLSPTILNCPQGN